MEMNGKIISYGGLTKIKHYLYYKLMHITKGIGLISPDAFLRYFLASKFILPNLVLDVGAGERPKLSLYRRDVLFISLDIERKEGIDIVGDARALPFRDKCFDTLVALDLLEHLRESERSKAINEFKRVAKRRIVIHMPLQNHDFYGKRYDLLLRGMLKKFRKQVRTLEEHLSHEYWSPRELRNRGFNLFGSYNGHLWIIIMTLSYALPYPLGVWLGWLSYFVFSRLFKGPPWWGAIAYCDL
jgi:hypothetical protein